MDLQHYWHIADSDIEIQNPVTDRKLRLLDDYCDIRDGVRVLDIGSGKAWVMRQWAERFDIEGIGLEVNPRFIKAARALAAARSVDRRLTFVQGPAADYKVEADTFDIVLCLGASFALGGFVEALEWMRIVAKPGAALVIGDLTLRHPPMVKHGPLPPNAIEAIALIERHGGEVSATISASEADFERYASHHRHSTLVWAREHPEHPDTSEILRKSRADWMHFQQTIRPQFGWTIFVARSRD